MRTMKSLRVPAASSAGFSLIELMVALAAGLVVIGALLAFVVSTVRAYTDNIRLTRLTEDLRAGMNVVVRDVRRTGYDAESVTKALTSEDASRYLAMAASESPGCVTYTYDGENDATESRGFRLDAATGALQMKVAAATVDCSSPEGWENISDPAVIEITRFVPRLAQARFCAEIGETTDPAGNTFQVVARGSVRTLAVCMAGNLRQDQAVTRHMTDVIRLRAENVRFTEEAVGTTCTADDRLVDPLEALVAWNEECAG